MRQIESEKWIEREQRESAGGQSDSMMPEFYDILFGKFQTCQSGNPTEKKLRPSLDSDEQLPGSTEYRGFMLDQPSSLRGFPKWIIHGCLFGQTRNKCCRGPV
jgi:hypothetical protein